MEKMFYGIGEVAKMLDENVSCIRYWSDEFAGFLKPSRNAKGNRRYTAADVETLRSVKFLVKTRGLTLDGARRELKDNRRKVDGTVKAVGILRDLREKLLEIRQTL